jgi:uncharacterized protein YggL (DUF469 family)
MHTQKLTQIYRPVEKMARKLSKKKKKKLKIPHYKKNYIIFVPFELPNSCTKHKILLGFS